MALKLARRVLARAKPAEADAALIAAVATGDIAAFERLHKRYHRRVFGFALRLTGRFDLAEEVVNDTMMTVWRKASGFEGRSKVSTWILGVAYRTAIKARRKSEPERLHDELDEQMQTDRTGLDEIEIIFDRERIAAALQRLPIEQRAIVELTYHYGYKLAEIAQITECPVGTVKSRMFHARAKLRALLSERPLWTGEVS